MGTADGQSMWAVGTDKKLYQLSLDLTDFVPTKVSDCSWTTVRSHGGDIYAIGHDKHIYSKKSSDVVTADSCADESWSQYDSKSWFSIAFANDAIYGVGDDGFLYERNDAGGWTKLRSDKWSAVAAFGTKF